MEPELLYRFAYFDNHLHVVMFSGLDDEDGFTEYGVALGSIQARIDSPEKRFFYSCEGFLDYQEALSHIEDFLIKNNGALIPPEAFNVEVAWN